MDPAAFQALALAEVDAVHRLAFHLSRSHHEADDLVQETYLRALRSGDGFALGEQGIRPWLFKILHNVLHSRRSRDRRTRDALRRFEEAAPTPPKTKSLDLPTTAINWDSTDERLYRAIRALPIAHRTVFLLAAVEDLKYREIALIVNAPVGTVMSRLSRARAVLAKQLGDLAAERNLPGLRPGSSDEMKV